VLHLRSIGIEKGKPNPDVKAQDVLKEAACEAGAWLHAIRAQLVL
jgi:hypothetical protein